MNIGLQLGSLDVPVDDRCEPAGSSSASDHPANDSAGCYFTPGRPHAFGDFTADATAPLNVFPRWRLPERIKRWLRRSRAGATPAEHVELAAQQMLHLFDASDCRVTCHAGRVWVSQQGDAVDVELRRGESLTIARSGLTLAHALEPSTLQVCGPGTRPD